jgi:hypothetical protein
MISSATSNRWCTFCTTGNTLSALSGCYMLLVNPNLHALCVLKSLTSRYALGVNSKPSAMHRSSMSIAK